MKLSLLAVTVVLVGAAACASAPPPAASVAPSPSPSPACADLRAQALHRLGDVLAAHRACTGDADCVSVGFGGSCFDACSRSVARSGEAALDAASADVDVHECSAFKAQGCRAESPPCAPPTPATCRQGLCQ